MWVKRASGTVVETSGPASPEALVDPPLATTAWQKTPPPSLSAEAKRASARELVAHTLQLGVSIEGDVAKKVQDAELAAGKGADPRVSAADMERAVRFSEQAAALVPARQSDLFGFTRVVDAKLSLDPKTLDLLAHACGDDAALLKAIDEGPGHGDVAFDRPRTPVELVASLVRQLALGAGASKQLALEPKLAAWLDGTLAGGGVAVRRAMGGAGAFAANLACAAGVDATFFSADPLPPGIADRFAPGVRAAARDGSVHDAHTWVGEQPARQNASAEYDAGVAYPLLGRERLRINGRDVAVVTGGSGRIILGTRAKDVRPGFAGVSDDALTRLARRTDLFFFVGAHYLTQGSAADARAEARALAGGLDVMKRANPALLRHAQYVVPKLHENEALVWGELKGHVDSLALNAVEVAPFVDSLFDGGLSRTDLDPHLPRAAAEDPAHMLEGALALVDALSLPRLQVHGLEGDLVVSGPGTPGAVNPERQKLALVKARQLATNKAAADSGEIKSKDDIWPVLPSVRGSGLAALHRFADAVAHANGLSAAERDRIVERWWWQAPDGTVVHFVPSRGIHDRSGGTVSLGDTIDASSLIFSIDPTRAPKIMHASSFA